MGEQRNMKDYKALDKKQLLELVMGWGKEEHGIPYFAEKFDVPEYVISNTIYSLRKLGVKVEPIRKPSMNKEFVNELRKSHPQLVRKEGDE